LVGRARENLTPEGVSYSEVADTAVRPKIVGAPTILFLESGKPAGFRGGGLGACTWESLTPEGVSYRMAGCGAVGPKNVGAPTFSIGNAGFEVVG